MAFRDDIHVEWYRSPRAIVVEAPSTSLNLQDLVDTMAVLESNIESLDQPSIVKSSGKQNLGDSKQVGITIVLQNGQVLFEASMTPLTTGTATSATQHDGLPGQILEDTAGDFSLVKPGDTVINVTDLSLATVIEKIDSTHIRHYQLEGGTSNEWAAGNSYRVYSSVQAEVTDGNLTAVDGLGDPIDAIVPSGFVSCMRELSTSASLNTADMTDLRHLIETTRPGHPATGDTFYWDPVNGNDARGGRSPAASVQTWARVLQLVTDWNHDAVICMAGNPAGVTIVTTPIEISVPTLIVRGPGRPFRFVPAAPGQPTVKISAPHVALSELDVYTAGGGTDDGVHVTGADDVLLENVHVRSPTRHGLNVDSSDLVKVAGLLVDSAGGDGIYAGAGVDRLFVSAPDVSGCAGSGLNLAAGACETRISGESRFMDNGGYGIVITAGCVKTTIGGMIACVNCAFGDVGDSGTDTFYTGSLLGGTMKSCLETVTAIECGRWKIEQNGGQSQLVCLKPDNVTEVARFNLKNMSGGPVDITKILVHDRIRV